MSSVETGRQAVADARADLEPVSRIPDYLPTLTDRFARGDIHPVGIGAWPSRSCTPEAVAVDVSAPTHPYPQPGEAPP